MAPSTSRAEFLDGVRVSLAATLSYMPFGVICGVAAIQAGMTEAQALGMPALVFGGASQVVVNQLLLAKAPLWVVIASGLIVNLRFIIYSAGLARHARGLPLGKRAAIAAFIVDHTYAFTEQRMATRRLERILPFYLGCALVVWPTWVLFNALGIFAGLLLPASWQLEFTIPLTFLCLVGPMLRDRGMWAAALGGAVAGLAFFGLPLRLGLIAACAAGVAAGMGADRWLRGKAGSS